MLLVLALLAGADGKDDKAELAVCGTRQLTSEVMDGKEQLTTTSNASADLRRCGT